MLLGKRLQSFASNSNCGELQLGVIALQLHRCSNSVPTTLLANPKHYVKAISLPELLHGWHDPFADVVVLDECAESSLYAFQFVCLRLARSILQHR